MYAYYHRLLFCNEQTKCNITRDVFSVGIEYSEVHNAFNITCNKHFVMNFPTMSVANQVDSIYSAAGQLYTWTDTGCMHLTCDKFYYYIHIHTRKGWQSAIGEEMG
jgi:ADP-dependent phosphofructokinase/glucokinase